MEDAFKSFNVVVTRCLGCPHRAYYGARTYCNGGASGGALTHKMELYEQNEYGITETCPMWAKENKQ
jgi:hypothetical protein